MTEEKKPLKAINLLGNISLKSHVLAIKVVN